MNKLTDWIKRHQITAFFIITFAISWGLGFSYVAVMNEGMFLLAPLVSVALCGPALAGIIISAVSNTQPKQGTSRTFWTPSLLPGVCLRSYFWPTTHSSTTLHSLPSWSFLPSFRWCRSPL